MQVTNYPNDLLMILLVVIKRFLLPHLIPEMVHLIGAVNCTDVRKSSELVVLDRALVVRYCRDRSRTQQPCGYVDDTGNTGNGRWSVHGGESSIGGDSAKCPLSTRKGGVVAASGGGHPRGYRANTQTGNGCWWVASRRTSTVPGLAEISRTST